MKYTLSQNFTKGNTKKLSACFLRLQVCYVITFQDDHARMRNNDPLVLLRHVFGDENS